MVRVMGALGLVLCAGVASAQPDGAPLQVPVPDAEASDAGAAEASDAATAGENVDALELSWARGPGADECPGRASLEAEIARRLGRAPVRTAEVASLEASITHAGGRWRADLQVRDARGAIVGRRALESTVSDCGAIFSATALAMSLALDTSGALREERVPHVAEASGPPPGSQAEPPSAPPPTDSAGAPGGSEPRRQSTTGFVALRAVGSTLAVGEVSGGGALAVGLPLGGRLAFHASAFYLPARPVEGGEGLRIGLTALSLHLGYALIDARWLVIELLGGGALGGQHVSERRPSGLESGDHGWGSLELGALLGYGLAGTPLRLELGALGVAPLSPRTFRHEEVSLTLYEEAAVGVLLWLGLAVVIS